METQKIINLLNGWSNEESKFATKKVSETVEQQKTNKSKAIVSSLKQKLLNQVFVTILMNLF